MNRILHTLQKAGYEAYVVGGCVRDSILGREPGDWDITTSASPRQTKALFRKTLDTGIKHGTVTVMLEKEGFEVTTYRIDGEYEDGRHPREVIFTSSLEEDLKRRDFTINAMAYSSETGIIDLFGGLEDLKRKRIRAVGDPSARFQEDALRIMRALRFAAQLDYTIEEHTLEAIGELAPSLEKISAERIRTELEKLLVSEHPELVRTAWEAGVTAVILPEFDRCMETPQNNPYHFGTVGEHTLKALQYVKADHVLRLAVLLHDVGKPCTRTTDKQGIDHFYGHCEKGALLAGQILHRLKYDNDTCRKVTALVRHHDLTEGKNKVQVRRRIRKIGEELFPAYMQVRRADLMAHSGYRHEELMTAFEKQEELYREILQDRDCLSLKDLAVNGSDLIRLGIRPGREIREILEWMLDLVTEDPSCNRREILLGEFLEKGGFKP